MPIKRRSFLRVLGLAPVVAVAAPLAARLGPAAQKTPRLWATLPSAAEPGVAKTLQQQWAAAPKYTNRVADALLDARGGVFNKESIILLRGGGLWDGK